MIQSRQASWNETAPLPGPAVRSRKLTEGSPCRARAALWLLGHEGACWGRRSAAPRWKGALGLRAECTSLTPASASLAHPACYSLLSSRWPVAWCSRLGAAAACPGHLTEAAKEQEDICGRRRRPRGGRGGKAYLLDWHFS